MGGVKFAATVGEILHCARHGKLDANRGRSDPLRQESPRRTPRKPRHI